MRKKLEITDNELKTLLSVIDEHKENIGTMSDDEYIILRRKEINTLNRFLKRNNLK